MRTTFGMFNKGLFLKVYRYIIVYYTIYNCGLLTKSNFRGPFPKVQRYAIIWFLICNCGPLARVLLLFQRNFSAGLVLMTQPVFQSLLVGHIWMLLLLQGIFSEVSVLMLSYSIVDHIYRCFSCFRRFFQQVQGSTCNLTFIPSFTVVFFRLVYNKKLFRMSSAKYRTILEDPT